MPYAIDGNSLPATGLFEGRLFYLNNGWATSDGLMVYYDDTNDQFLSLQEFERTVTLGGLSSSSGSAIGGRIATAYPIFVTGIYLSTVVSTTNNGSNYWQIQIYSYGPTYTTGSGTSLISTISTGDTPDTAGNWTNHDADVAWSDQSPSNYGLFNVTYTKNSSPGNLALAVGVKFRYIVS